MNQSQSQIGSLLLIVALLAIGGGLAIVIVTSPQSWEMGPMAWLQGPPATLTPAPPSATPAPSETATALAPTPTPPSTATLSPTSTSDRAAPTATELISETATAGPSPTLPPPTPGPVVTSSTLPEDVSALAVVTLQSGAISARLRDAPNSTATILAAVPNGTEVQVLFGRVEAENNMWVQVRLANGTSGWMAEFLLRYTVTRPATTTP